jgi:uncharacterized membrane protein
MLGIYLLLAVVVIILEVVITYRFKMALWIIAEYPEMRPVDAMRNSMTLMKGKCWKLFRLQFSFIGWILLAMLTLGIGLLWVIPYMQTAMAAFYLDVKNVYNNNI